VREGDGGSDIDISELSNDDGEDELYDGFGKEEGEGEEGKEGNDEATKSQV
jgi:hypothetical protein